MTNVPGSSAKKSEVERTVEQIWPEISIKPSKIKETAMPLVTAFELTLGNNEKYINKLKAKKNYKYKLTTNAKPLKQVGTQMPSTSSLTGLLLQQTEPPTIPVAKIFCGSKYPMGENMEHPLPKHDDRSAINRVTMEEKQQIEIAQSEYYNSLRHAAEIHRQTRQHMLSYIKPGMLLYNICEELENTVKRLLYETDTMKAGLAYPPTLSLNNCVANFSPSLEDTSVLNSKDICKLNFGTHIKGHIIDSGYTFSFNQNFEKLIEAVREATNTGIKESGIDARLCGIGAAMKEVVSSYEVELRGKFYRIRAVPSLYGGHLLGPYNLHAGKIIGLKKSKESLRMIENESYVIQIFGTTGKAVLHENNASSFYMRTLKKNHIPLRQQSSKHLLCTINRYFGTLGFSKRWLDQIGATKYRVPLDDLCEKGVVKQYLPLYDTRNTYSAQYGHTLILRPTCKEVLSRGNDY